MPGHAAALPGQFSAMSQTPADERHSSVAGRKASAGQLTEDPLQFSAMSQTPAEVRHTRVAGCSASLGQAAALPEQFSAVSQTPAEARHSSLEGRKASVGHAPEDPVQDSAMSHEPADGRQAAPLGLKVHVEEQQEAAVPLALPASHCSPGSTLALPQTVFSTVTFRVSCAVCVPRVATALSVCVPLLRIGASVFHCTLYGAVLSVANGVAAVSTKNSTLVVCEP